MTVEIAVLLGRGMPPGAQDRSLAEIGALLIARGAAARVEVAFLEFGAPSLEDKLAALDAEGVKDCVVVPAVVPFDRALGLWLGRWLSHWTRETGLRLRVTLADPIDETRDIAEPIAAALARAAGRADIRDLAKPLKRKPGASMLPPTAKMALVCLGPRCVSVGGLEVYRRIYGRFGSLGERRPDDAKLLCLRTNCQGPCNFGPVVAVQPDGIWYGMLTPAIVDEIVEQHLACDGAPLAAHALPPGTRLRPGEGDEPDADAVPNIDTDGA